MTVNGQRNVFYESEPPGFDELVFVTDDFFLIRDRNFYYRIIF